MSSPVNLRSRYDATYDWVGITIAHKLRHRFRSGSTTILDVGAGWGKYRDLLPEYVMDACEIWAEYIWNEMLEIRYRNVFQTDICSLEFDFYNVIIMGDVFEHIERENAKNLLERIYSKCDEAYIAVPFEYPQGPVDGNPYEAHLQDDLTPELMEKEYPLLQLVDQDVQKGLYILRK